MTDMSTELGGILHSMKRAHLAAGPATAGLRRDRLERAARLLIENRDALARAISADFGNRAIYHTLTADIATTAAGLRHSAAQLETWMAREDVTGLDQEVQAWIEPQPLGVVGIVSPWNFPLNLAFAPLAGVFAAGNTALIKPSEFTPRTADLVADLIGASFDANELGVVIGGPDVASAFTALPFDHLVFTGSTQVGKIVMRAAADNLVPVTLELGGKCPVVIDEGFDITTAAERTLTVKTFNAGQICLSPDYVMLPEAAVDGFVASARAFMTRTFPTIQTNPDYTSLIAPRHYERLMALIADAEAKGATAVPLAPEGEPFHCAESRKIAPVLLLGVNDTMRVMQEEIFGPLLPIMTVPSLSTAINHITAHDRPLAAYLFSNDQASRERFAKGVTSGALVINDIMLHASIDALPFGGVGASGIGAYHGVHGFRRFSHFRPVVVQGAGGASGIRLRAPYAEKQSALEKALSGQS
ncbi:coniferyl-aldehyde dehydrogenase [Agrobacterium vitis]|nr:coniferyl-aldehyde dehydrogenase [Agrobacterium vitis]MBE1439464.1 coniferyl-aldehyde dehydrogenase [Agrobacterium vitis]